MSILTIQNGTHNLNGQQRLDLNPFTEEQPHVCSDRFPIFSWTQQAMGLTFGTQCVLASGLSTTMLITPQCVVLR